jgi:hypothetical protein
VKSFPVLLTSVFLALWAVPAAAQSTRTVFINGVALQATATQRNGETYYQFRASDLQRIGALTAGGVSPRVDAIRGCVGDTLFNGVYSVQLLRAGPEDTRFGVQLKLTNASSQTLQNFMTFSPSEIYAATATAATPLPNFQGRWIDTLLPGTAIILRTQTDDRGAATRWTRLLIRPDADAVRELQKARLPLARIYNLEFDLTCQK